MNTRWNKRVTLHSLAHFLQVSLLISLLTSCQTLEKLEPEYWQEQEIAFESGTYTIEPETIIDSINEDKTDIFSPYAGNPDAAISTDNTLVNWSQADYFQVANAFYEHIWGETWKDWKLADLLFRLNCDQVENGPQLFVMSLFKVVPNQEDSTRLLRRISIRPLENIAEWSEAKRFPIREQWKSIEISRVKIPSQVALDVAEENGGSEIRLEQENGCDIYIFLTASSWDDGWQVTYSADKGSEPLFTIFVDPESGSKK